MGYITYSVEVVPGVTVAITIEDGHPIQKSLHPATSNELISRMHDVLGVTYSVISGQNLSQHQKLAQSLGLKIEDLNEIPGHTEMWSDLNPYLPD